MDVQTAAEGMLDLIQKSPDFSVDDLVVTGDGKSAMPTSHEHLIWMLSGIKLEYISGEKAHRWIGYVQGVLVANGTLALDIVKLVNKES